MKFLPSWWFIYLRCLEKIKCTFSRSTITTSPFLFKVLSVLLIVYHSGYLLIQKLTSLIFLPISFFVNITLIFEFTLELNDVTIASIVVVLNKIFCYLDISSWLSYIKEKIETLNFRVLKTLSISASCLFVNPFTSRSLH